MKKNELLKLIKEELNEYVVDVDKIQKGATFREMMSQLQYAVILAKDLSMHPDQIIGNESELLKRMLVKVWVSFGNDMDQIFKTDAFLKESISKEVLVNAFNETDLDVIEVLYNGDFIKIDKNTIDKTGSNKFVKGYSFDEKGTRKEIDVYLHKIESLEVPGQGASDMPSHPEL